MKVKKIPMRLCIACKESKPKRELIRIIKDNTDKISLDLTGKANGRGAYICDNEECIKKCVKNKLLNKVFSCAIEDSVYNGVLEQYEQRKN
jgi:predicted RNA-binding protein YlxR (DUF448 family)